MATEDLDKYHRALEKALLTFHATKMADINKARAGGGGVEGLEGLDQGCRPGV
jgi:hypothetical protein